MGAFALVRPMARKPHPASTPPLFARRDKATGEPKKTKFGPWIFPVFRVLAKLKFLRGTALDPFGYTAERRTERKLIADYEVLLSEILGRLTPENHAMAVGLASIPEKIRGFGHVKMRHLQTAKAEEGALLEQFRSTQLLHDFPRWIEENVEPFVPGAGPRMRDWLAQMALQCSLQALHDCHLVVEACDMAAELEAVDVPVLLIAGALDVSAPPDLTARRTSALVPDCRLIVYEDAAHGMFLTHVEQVNGELLEFIRAEV